MISRLANWILYAVILAVIGALIYYYTDWFKPATEKAFVAAKSVVESMPLGPFSKKEGGDEAVAQAREAYARGDAEAAIRAYSDIVKKNPGNMDAQGELGNVYYMTGRLPEAAAAFYEAAKLMIEQNQIGRAQALLAPIGQGNPVLANELQQKLMQAQMPPQQMPPQQMPPQQMPPQQMPPQQMPPQQMPPQQSQAPQEGQPPQMSGYPGMPMGQPRDEGYEGYGAGPDEGQPGGPMGMAPPYQQGPEQGPPGAPRYY
jgi:tetratricopeptide (TPR) repeat protein